MANLSAWDPMAGVPTEVAVAKVGYGVAKAGYASTVSADYVYVADFSKAVFFVSADFLS